MIKGLYTAESSMRPKMARMEVIANNLANINSTGFKRDRLFIEMLDDASAAKASGQAQDFDGVKTQRYIDFAEGSLEKTGNPLDVAVQGRGFLVVDTPQGLRYTRNGNFTISPAGMLTTSQGYPVMGTQGHIQFPDLQKMVQGNVAISERGEISLDKQEIAKLRIVDFEDYSTLQKDHESLFVPATGQPVVEGPGKVTALRQGYLEESNVEGIEEMIAMLELNRSFETDQKSIIAQDESIGRSIEVGKL